MAHRVHFGNFRQQRCRFTLQIIRNIAFGRPGCRSLGIIPAILAGMFKYQHVLSYMGEVDPVQNKWFCFLLLYACVQNLLRASVRAAAPGKIEQILKPSVPVAASQYIYPDLQSFWFLLHRSATYFSAPDNPAPAAHHQAHPAP